MAYLLPQDNYDSYLSTGASTTDTTFYVNELPTQSSGVLTIYEQDGRTLREKIYYAGTAGAGTSSDPYRLTGCIRRIRTVPVSGVILFTSGGTGLTHGARRRIAMTDNINYSGLALAVLNGDMPMGGVMQLPATRSIDSARDVIDKEYFDAGVAAAGGITAFYVTQNGADPSLTINVGVGRLIVGNETIVYAGAAAQAVTALSTNYVELTNLGTLSINTTGFTAGYLPLAEVVTDATDITSVTDRRPWLTLAQTDKSITDDITYGETIAAGDPLYYDSATGRAKKATAAAAATSLLFLGRAIDAGVNGDTGKRIQLSGFMVTGLSGLTPGGYVYVTDASGFSSTPGTYRVTVGFAVSATAFIMQPTLDIAAITGATSAWTTAAMTAAMNWFVAPYNQPVRRTVTATEDLLAGEVVALTGSGVELSNMKDFGTLGTTTDVSQGVSGAHHKVIDGATPTASAGSAVGIGVKDSVLGVWRLNFVPSTGVTTVTDQTMSTADAGATNTGGVDGCQLESDKVLIAYKFGAATYNIRAKIYTPSSGAEGSEVTVVSPGAGASNFIAVMRVSSTEAVVLYTDAAGLKFVRLTISGTTITVGASGTVLADVDLTGVFAAEQYGTSGYFMLVVRTSSTSRMNYILCQYAAGVFSNVGAKTEFDSATTNTSYHVKIISMSDTKMLVVGTFGSDIKGMIATRSGSTISLDASTNLITTVNTGCEPGLRKIGEKTFTVSGQPSGANSNTYVRLFKVKNAYSAIEALGTQTSLDGQNNSRQSNPALVQKVNPSVLWVGYPRYSGSDYLRHAAYAMTTNYEKVIGVVEADIASAATGSVIVDGTSDDCSGLTAGEASYADCSGDVTIYNVGTTRRVGVNESTTVMIVD